MAKAQGSELDEGSVGIKVLAGLPEGHGLSSIAGDLLDDPRPVYALVELRPKKEVTDIDNGSHQLVLKVVQVEPLAGKAADTMRDQLRKVREKRTGVVSLTGPDGEPMEVPPAGAKPAADPDPKPDAEPAAEPEEPRGDLPVGPEWGDKGEEPTVPPEPTLKVVQDTAVGAPPFAPPTPIDKGKRTNSG